MRDYPRLIANRDAPKTTRWHNLGIPSEEEARANIMLKRINAHCCNRSFVDRTSQYNNTIIDLRRSTLATARGLRSVHRRELPRPGEQVACDCRWQDATVADRHRPAVVAVRTSGVAPARFGLFKAYGRAYIWYAYRSRLLIAKA